MSIENFKEIADYFETNKDSEDVKNYVGGMITPDRVENFLNTDDGKKLLQPKLDKNFNKGLDSWKINNLQKLVDDKVNELYPKADPKDLELKKLQQQIDKMQKDTLHKELTNKAYKLATEKKIPNDLVDYFVGDDEEATVNNINKLADIFTAHDETIRKEFAKGNSYTPPDDKNSGNLSGADKLREEIRKNMKF